MKITYLQHEELEARTSPADEVRTLTRDYLARTQLSHVQFARRINYAVTALSAFLADKYQGQIAASDVRVRVAITDYIAAHPIQAGTGSLGTLYETENVLRMRALFDNTLRSRAMSFCYGAPGSQKTWVFTHLVAEHNRREIPNNGHGSRAYMVYCSVASTPRELIRKICLAALVPAGNTIQDAIRNLRWDLGKRRSIFVLDEAQHLPVRTLEIVRELHDCEPHCGILLAGSHQLAQLFRQRGAELEQWNSRLAAGVKLPGMTRPEAIAIIAAELGKLPFEQVQSILDHAEVPDAYHDGQRIRTNKGKNYISARRLFRQVADIGNHPLFVREAQPASYPEGATA